MCFKEALGASVTFVMAGPGQIVCVVGNCQVLLSTEYLETILGHIEIISRQLQVRPALFLRLMHEGRPASLP